MPGSWEFLMAEAEERARFVGRAAILDLPYELAAPANRARRTVRVFLQGRAWYFKQFGPPSWKNRWRFRATPPHAQDDAEREALMTLLLREHGIETPRPVLRGRDETGSCYLCAELPGRSLHDWLRRGPIAPGLLAMCAAFCGDVLRKGFHLPDLSAEHVFVRREVAFFHFGLIDLHNGARMPAGPPPLWLCRRVLRHFMRSVQDVPIARRQALRFAARLLHNAGRGASTRALLKQLPPMDTAERYERPGKALAYRDRDRDRTDRERDLLARVWPGRPGERVLDVPCGAGRLLPFLRARGHEVVQADRAQQMLRQARELSKATRSVQAHALALPFADASVDGVVSFRFLHHLERSAAKLAVAEACRVARRFVVLSFFHPCSAHHGSRRLRDLLQRRAPTRFALTLGRLRRWCEGHGFELAAHRADLPFVKDLWIATFVRRH